MKKMIIGKLIKNIAIIGLALILTLCCLGLTGCQNNEPEPSKEDIQQELDVVVLEQEYFAIMRLIDNVLFTITNDEDLTMDDAIKLFDYMTKNRIKPTQKLTIELDNCLDDLMELGLTYTIAANEQEKTKVAEEITLILNRMNELMIEIEEIINNNYEFI
jgi:dimeric dUTPase (all-alpha-NTP-PPase superfamily)